MIQNRRRTLIMIGVVLAACVVVITGIYLFPSSTGNTACPDCQPFFGGIERNGDDLLLVIRHEHCKPAACNPCGAHADGYRSLNISVTPENGRQVFIEHPGRLYEAVRIPGAFADITDARVEVSVNYIGWENRSCTLNVVDTRV